MLPKAKRLIAEQPTINKLVCELQQAMNLSRGKFVNELGMIFPTVNRWEIGHSTSSSLVLKPLEILLQRLGDRGQALRTKYFSEGEAAL